MRPVKRDSSPPGGVFNHYTDAKAELISRLGRFCSYCEREISTVLAVEHIQPKGLAKYAHLNLTWSNFLLACVNCNSTKKDKDLELSDVLLPDRDNTFLAFDYSEDGRVDVADNIVGTPLEEKARNILSITGLDKPYSEVLDFNGKAVALDRIGQRIEKIGIAKTLLKLYEQAPTPQMAQAVAINASSSGYFSIWLKVFSAHPNVLNALISAFPGTPESGCFDPTNGATISPHPNSDHLNFGGRI